jgi:hypothetical protein
MTPAAASSTGAIQINIVDGTRKPVAAKTGFPAPNLDGRHQQVIAPWVTGPSIHVADLPYHDNLDDRYTVFVYSKGHEDAAIYPVQLNRAVPGGELMALPKNPKLHFRPWAAMQGVDKHLPAVADERRHESVAAIRGHHGIAPTERARC